jgi:hypothetical protein
MKMMMRPENVGKKLQTTLHKTLSTDMNFTTASNGSESENKDVESLDTKPKRQQGKSNFGLAKTINNALKEYLDKADKRTTQALKNLPKNFPILQKSMTPGQH